MGPAPVSRVRVLLGEAAPPCACRSPVRSACAPRRHAVPARAEAFAFGPGLASVRARTPLAGPLLFSGAEPLLSTGRPTAASSRWPSRPGSSTRQRRRAGGTTSPGSSRDEVPSAWPEEALKAQAVVARSYALAPRAARASTSTRTCAARSTAAYGLEEPTTTTAVARPRARCCCRGKPVDALFHSTSGGSDSGRRRSLRRGGSVSRFGPGPVRRASPVNRWGPVLLPRRRRARALKRARP